MFKSVLFFFFFSPIFLVRTHDNCNGVTLSLDDIQYRSGNQIIAKPTITFDLPNYTPSTSCQEIISPDGLTDSMPVDYTSVSCNYIINVDNIHHTDKPFVFAVSDTECAPFLSNSCANLPLPIKSTDPFVCRSGGHRSKKCLLNLGTYTLKLGFTGYPRFRIYKMSKIVSTMFEYMVHEEANYTVDTSYFFTGSPTTTTLPFGEITVVSSSDTFTFPCDYLLVDLYSPSQAYCMPSEYFSIPGNPDISKIDWYDADSNKVPASLASELSVYVDDDLTLHWNGPLTNIITFLANRTDLLLNKVVPGCKLYDPNLYVADHKYDTEPDHSIIGWDMCVDCFKITDIYGTTHQLGYNYKGEVIPPPTQAHPTWNGPQQAECVCSDGITRRMAGLPYAVVLLSEDPPVRLYMLYPPSGGFCFQWYSENEFGNGTLISFEAKNYPHNHFTTNIYDGTFIFGAYDPPEITSVKVVCEASAGVTTQRVVMNEMTIAVTEGSAIPLMRNLIYDNETMSFQAKSSTSGGTCILGTIPVGIVTSQTIALSVSWTDYTVDVSIPDFNGTARLLIDCTNGKVNQSVDFSISQLEGAVEFYGNDSTPWYNSLNPVNVGDYLGAIFGYGSENFVWWEYIVSFVVFVIVAFIAGIIILSLSTFLLWPLIKWFFFKILFFLSIIYPPLGFFRRTPKWVLKKKKI